MTSVANMFTKLVTPVKPVDIIIASTSQECGQNAKSCVGAEAGEKPLVLSQLPILPGVSAGKIVAQCQL